MAFRAAVAAALLALAAPAAAQDDARAFVRGGLTDPVVSHSNPDQRYVVFLPSAFDPGRPTPILYVMDYRGRARMAAEVFEPAAERLGWIVVSSYNSFSDGRTEPNLVALQAMWADSHERFTIDDRRTYIAGASGTARIATLVARRFAGTFTGVIGSAAAFHPDAPPTRDMPFLYFGTVGDVDYNYWEMRLLEARLTQLQLPHRVEYFAGRHGWMSDGMAAKALEWMELHAMKSGARAIDDAFVADLWTRDEVWASTLERAGLIVQSSRRLEAMARDYAGLRPIADIEAAAARAATLAATPEARAQVRAAERAAARHETRIDEAMSTLARAYRTDADVPAMTPGATLRELGIERLKTDARSQDDETALAAERVLAELGVQTGFYLPVEALGQGEDDRAAFYLTLFHAIDPDDAFAWYLTSLIHARHRRADAAVEALERAVELGFSTVDPLEHDPAFVRLRTVPAFAAIVENLKDGRQAP